MGKKKNKKGEATCFHKIKYDSKEDAKRFFNLIKKRLSDKKGLSYYKCKFCKGWHIGHKNKEIN